MVSDLAAVDAACREAGAIRVSSLAETIEVAKVLLGGDRPAGPRVAIVTDGGGHGVIAADLATRAGPRAADPERGAAAADRRPAARAAGRREPDRSRRRRRAGPRQLREGDRGAGRLWRGRLGRPHRVLRRLQRRCGRGGERRRIARPRSPGGWPKQRRSGGTPLLAQTMFWTSGPAVALRDSGCASVREDRRRDRLPRSGSRDDARRGPGVLPLPPPEPEIEGDGYWVARRSDLGRRRPAGHLGPGRKP